MIVVDLKSLIFLFILALLGSALLAVWIDRRARQPTATQVGYGLSDIRDALEAAPFGLILLDAQSMCIYANLYARHLLSLGEPPASLPEEEWCDLLREDLAAAHRRDATNSYRVAALKPDQHVRWWIHSLRDLSLVFLMDISRQWRTEQAYHTFVSNLSHEMRTPLTAILAHLEVLRTSEVSEVTRDQSLSLIQRETHRINRLVQDLLEMSRVEMAPEMAQRPVDILVVAEEAIAQIILSAEERQIEVSLRADASLPPVLGDADRLEQIFLNVLDNAVKYCRPGDQVEVHLRIEPDGVGCTIRDTGPGIPPQHLPHVTQRLYRIRTDVEGSGLGLALVEEILRRHQSRLEIESQSEGEQTGTRLHFVLPTLPQSPTSSHERKLARSEEVEHDSASPLLTTHGAVRRQEPE